MKFYLKPKMSLDEMAKKLHSENRLDEEKLKKVKLELQQHRNLLIILALLITCSAYYTGHYRHAVLLTILFPLGIWESIVLFINNIYLHSFGIKTTARFEKKKLLNPYAAAYWKLKYYYLDRNQLEHTARAMMHKKKNPILEDSTSLEILYDPLNPKDSKPILQLDKYSISNGINR